MKTVQEYHRRVPNMHLLSYEGQHTGSMLMQPYRTHTYAPPTCEPHCSFQHILLTKTFVLIQQIATAELARYVHRMTHIPPHMDRGMQACRAQYTTSCRVHEMLPVLCNVHLRLHQDMLSCCSPVFLRGSLGSGRHAVCLSVISMHVPIHRPEAAQRG